MKKLQVCSLVYSHLQYGITSWGFADAFYMKLLNTLNNIVLRIIANCGYTVEQNYLLSIKHKISLN